MFSRAAVIQSQVEYLNVQLLYVLARLLENPEGGPARLAAQDIEVMAQALQTGAAFTSLEQVLGTLELVQKLSDDKAAYLNTIADVTDAGVVHWANALHRSRTKRDSLVVPGGEAYKEERRREVLNAVYDLRGIPQDQECMVNNLKERVNG